MEGFEAWVRYQFGQSGESGLVTDQVVIAERLRHLFSNAGSILGPYSDDQVARGLREIIDDDIFALTSAKVPVRLRTSGLRSVVTLFAEVFAPRIVVEDPQQKPKLQSLCFMFFDIVPFDLGEDTALDVLEDTLALASVPCQRSALHGLGHAYLKAPQHVPAIVDRWLARNPRAPQELRDYAMSARCGNVM